jgi:hypothetical protein
MVRQKMLVIREEIWILFAIFMFIILFPYILIRLRVTDTGSLTIFTLLRCIKFMFHERESINLFQTSSNKYHTNNFVIIKQVHFILIKWNFYDHYFTDVCTVKKKFTLVVRGIQNCEFSGPWRLNGWRPLCKISGSQQGPYGPPGGHAVFMRGHS